MVEVYACNRNKQILVIYYEGAFYDITPLGLHLTTSCTFDTVNTSATVTVNKAAHGLEPGDIFLFSSVTPINMELVTLAADFTTNPFQVVTVPGSDEFTITMVSAAGTTVNGSGSATFNSLYQTWCFGFNIWIWMGHRIMG